MENYEVLNLLVKHQKDELNALYKNQNSNLISKLLKICKLSQSNSAKIAVLRRIVDLKEENLITELKNLGANETKIRKIKAKSYDFVSDFYIKRQANLITQIKQMGLLSEFNEAVIELVHEVGIIITAMHKSWQKQVIDTTNAKFKAKFKTIKEANKFISKNKLYQTNPDKTRADRSYGVVVKDKNSYKFIPYAMAFKNEIKALKSVFERYIEILNSLALDKNDKAYIKYFKKLALAFCECDNNKVLWRWQEAERAWMGVRGKLQIGHPLEYYEDAYTKAVALEWDIRLVGTENINESEFKQKFIQTFNQIYSQTSIKNDKMQNLVISNINKTQLYISTPMIYYGADFNGLFSAQVVPNDEIVSRECGKKIFAFVDFIYESAKSRPFMKLSNEIFEKDFLDFGREILFKQPKIWKKVYEISTIGHEFGHILFIDDDSENLMNKSGEFKFIEEYKATTGGLVNFFLHEDEAYKMPVFYELIKRAIGLIAWQKVNEVRAYYCEGLIHLGILFKSGVLGFENNKLSIDFTDGAYERFKKAVFENYLNLATHYSKKKNAGEFLSKFAEFKDDIYLPLDTQTRAFVEYYYKLYEKMANEIDDSGEWQKWQEI